MANPDYSDGCMIALYPSLGVAAALAVSGGLPIEELHLTVAYCGSAVDVDPEALLLAAQKAAVRSPVSGSIAGHGRFTGGDSDVAVALVDSSELERLRRDLVDALADQGIEVPADHGYTAHITQSYIDPDDPAPVGRIAAMPVSFAALSVVHGSKRTDLPFDVPPHPIESYARRAFAAGWASSGGPMTPRVQEACAAAVHLAVESADDPDVLAATVDLGKLEGLWALLFERRESLQAEHTRNVTAAWRPLISPDALATMVERLWERLGLAESATADITAETLAAARSMLQGLAEHPGYGALRSALHDAIAAGRAEGAVNAVALAADRAGRDGLDWDVGFADAYAELHRLHDLDAEADHWLSATITRAIADLGRILAAGANRGDSAGQTAATSMDALTGRTVPGVVFVVDWAMTTVEGASALDVYRSQGVISLDWITAGDKVVCALCKHNERQNPWPVEEFPVIPSHPGCRCVPVAGMPLAQYDRWFT